MDQMESDSIDYPAALLLYGRVEAGAQAHRS
jgi:hypothetical protein